MDIAYVNLKPGTGKTTCAVWTAHALHELGYEVWLIDADPAASALRWSDLADGFPFSIVGLPTRDVHRRALEYGSDDAVRVYDTPQMESSPGIVRSVLRRVDEVVVPVAPAPIEIDRMAPVRNEVDELEPTRAVPVRMSVLLNRVVATASSGPYWRGLLTEDEYDVLNTEVGRRESYAQSFSEPVRTQRSEYQVLAEELLQRHKEGDAR